MDPSDWRMVAPALLYGAFSGSDLLPIEPPRPGETIHEFTTRAEETGDMLFLFLCREADDNINAAEYFTRLGEALHKITHVMDTFGALQFGPQSDKC